MDKNQKIAVAVIVVIAIVAAWQLGKKPAGQDSQNQTNSANSSNDVKASDNQAGGQKTGEQMTGADSMMGSVWQGMLMKSDNTHKGNLMLKTTDHTIYLNTNRDYSALVGKEVSVSYKGNLDSFSLKSITAK